MERKKDDWRFVVIWEFRAPSGQKDAFERAYGADGQWVRLFREDEAYLGTELIRDLKAEGSYLTLDFWESEEAYDAFRAKHAAEYEAIDAECESLTESEREVGRYRRVADCR